MGNSWNLPLSGKIILLDPGHGGPDGGAGTGKTLEKDIALEITIKSQRLSSGAGCLGNHDKGNR